MSERPDGAEPPAERATPPGGSAPRFAEPPLSDEVGRDRSEQPATGRQLAAPRTRGQALAYFLALAALYGGIVAVVVLDAAGPTCAGPSCATVRPGIRPAALIAALGLAGLVALAVHLTRTYAYRPEPAQQPQFRRRRRSASGWPLAWNYLAAALVVPDAVRALRRPATRRGAPPGAAR
jgi:hypothetical protein